MSSGYCGKCQMAEIDEDIVIYKYSGENWNDENSHSGDIDLLDGEIWINISCLEEPEIHIKTKKSPSGRKYIQEKRIVHVPSIHKHISNGDISIVKKCKNEFEHFAYKGNDCYIAWRLLIHIFEYYQENGELPESEYFIQ